MDTLIDESLMALQDRYFESGDDEELVHMYSEQFPQLMPTAQCGPFSE
jgi:Ala-tRNA(Pro) deacylase